MQEKLNKSILQEMISQLDLSENTQKIVQERYESLSNWFSREDSSVKDIDLFSQGSFALGTTIKPLNEGEEYDLDMGCKIKIEDYKESNSQKDLKDMIGAELELYRKNVGIQSPLESKRRCWRLEYRDEVSFHLDVVPCIPLADTQKIVYEQYLEKSYNDKIFAEEVAHLAVNITDSERQNYKEISPDWNISNSQGYVKWFQKRMLIGTNVLFEARKNIEPIPVYKEKSILQRCIQLLKRHRDNMFKDNKDSKPISVIITTLASRAYNGENSLEEAMLNILNDMPRYVDSKKPRIPNPVKPEEDFTDRWDNPEFNNLNLEQNFEAWIFQAKLDFQNLLKADKVKDVKLILNERFSLDVNEKDLINEYGLSSDLTLPIQKLVEPQTKPWRT